MAPPAPKATPVQETDPGDRAELSSGGAGPSLPAQGHATATAAAVAGVAGGSAVAAGLFEGLKSGFVKGYLTPSEVYARARRLAAEHPELVELIERPYQTQGYDGCREDLRGPAPLWYLRVGRRDGADRDARVGVLQIAAPHAREWIQPMIVTELAEQMVANYDRSSTAPAVRANTRQLDELDVFLVPCSNPDGTNYSMHDEDMWRKNRRPNGDGTSGVDVNRNYPYNFVSEDPTHEETYAGPRPSSEPETRHVTQIVDDHPNIRFVADWHSYGEEVRRPWGVSERDRAFYDRFHGRMQDAIATVRGREYQTTESRVVNGASDDYFYHARGLFSTIIEDAREFHPPVEEALQVMREGVAGARELLAVAAEYGRAHGLEKAHPPCEKPADPPAA